MTEDRIEVWGIGTARTFRVYWALHELGLEYRSHPVRTRTSDMEDAAFLAVSPGRKIPVVRHGGFVLRESLAIVDYLYRLCDRVPTDQRDAARIAQWASFAAMELDATALYVLRRHQDLPSIYGEAPAAVQAATEYFARQAGVLDDELVDGRAFLVGDRLTSADIVTVTCCVWAARIGLNLPACLKTYAARHEASTAFGAAGRANFSGTKS